MGTTTKILLGLAVVFTIASLGAWAATDFHPYTKYQVVEEVEKTPDPDDPFAGTGLVEEGEVETEVVTRDEFHFGLLPTPQGLFDKHFVSVVTFAVPLWVLAAASWFVTRRKQQHSAPAPAQGE